MSNHKDKGKMEDLKKMEGGRRIAEALDGAFYDMTDAYMAAVHAAKLTAEAVGCMPGNEYVRVAAEDVERFKGMLKELAVRLDRLSKEASNWQQKQ